MDHVRYVAIQVSLAMLNNDIELYTNTFWGRVQFLGNMTSEKNC